MVILFMYKNKSKCYGFINTLVAYLIVNDGPVPTWLNLAYFKRKCVIRHLFIYFFCFRSTTMDTWLLMDHFTAGLHTSSQVMVEETSSLHSGQILTIVGMVSSHINNTPLAVSLQRPHKTLTNTSLTWASLLHGSL